MVESVYWKFKAKMLEIIMEESQIRQALKETIDRRNKLAVEYSFEENTSYKFDDATYTVEKVNG